MVTLMGKKLLEWLLGWLFQYGKTMVERRRMAQTRRNLVMSTQRREALERARAQLGGVRAILLSTHNGGAAIVNNTRLKSSVLEEACRTPAQDSVLATWQGEPADSTHKKLLMRLIDERVILVTIDDMEPGMLSDLYRARTVQLAAMALVRVGDTIEYVSIHLDTLPSSDAENKQLRAEARNAARSLSSELRGLLEL